jgi:uncharacterized protein YndB with AHSA1/START domain
VPTVSRSATVDAPPERIWQLVSDPHSLPRWWPRVQRVEEASAEAWTKVLTSDRGKPVRADYTRVTAQPPALLEWQQELAETPFERILSEARLRISIENVPGDDTEVTLTAVERLRGLSRLGGFMVRRATRKRLEEALERLALAVE